MVQLAEEVEPCLRPDWSRVVNPMMAWQEMAMTPDDPPGGYNGMRKGKPRLVPDEPPRLLFPLGRTVAASVAPGRWAHVFQAGRVWKQKVQYLHALLARPTPNPHPPPPNPQPPRQRRRRAQRPPSGAFAG